MILQFLPLVHSKVRKQSFTAEALITLLNVIIKEFEVLPFETEGDQILSMNILFAGE